MKKIQGKVTKVFSKALEEPETFVFDGKTITNTHRHSLEIEGLGWINFPNNSADAFLAEDDDGNYKILGVGSEVLVKYTERQGEQGDTVFRNAKKKGLTVIDFVEGKRYDAKEKQQEHAKAAVEDTFDTSGLECGHAINCAYIITGYEENNVLEIAKQIHAITIKVKDYWIEKTGGSKKNCGQAAGNAVSNACGLIYYSDSLNIDKLEDLSKLILEKISNPLLTYIKEQNKPAAKKDKEEPALSFDAPAKKEDPKQESKKETKADAKPKRKRRTKAEIEADKAKAETKEVAAPEKVNTPKQEEVEPKESITDFDSPDAFDDDIPF